MATRTVLAVSVTAWAWTAAAHGQELTLTRDSVGCENPRAVHALTNAYEPRRWDPRWVAFVTADGRCVTLRTGTRASQVAEQGDLLLVEVRPGGSRFYTPRDGVAASTPPPPRPEASLGLGGWFPARSPDQHACEVRSSPSSGRLTVRGSLDRPGVLQVTLAGPTSLEASTPVKATFSFSDGTVVPMTGSSVAGAARFELGAELSKSWMHGFTAASTGSVVLSPGQGASITLDLRGTSIAIADLARCAAEEGLRLPPPFVAVASTLPSQDITGTPSAPNRMPDPAPAASGLTREYRPAVKLFVEDERRPTIHGRTNLPDGAELLVGLSRPESAYFGQAKVTVRDGQFATERFSQNGNPLNPGRYKVEVSMSLAALQPETVRAVIGEHGEKMSGSWVTPSPFGPSDKVFTSTDYKQLGGVADPALDASAKAQSLVELREWEIRNCRSNPDMINALVLAGAPGKLLQGAERERYVEDCVARARARP